MATQHSPHSNHDSEITRAQFDIGQIIRHRLFDYRGVVVEADPSFCNSDEWYENMTITRPSKNQPWYRVLVDESEQETYVAECNLLADDNEHPVEHPRIDEFFHYFYEGRYHSNQACN